MQRPAAQRVSSQADGLPHDRQHIFAQLFRSRVRCCSHAQKDSAALGRARGPVYRASELHSYSPLFPSRALGRGRSPSLSLFLCSLLSLLFSSFTETLPFFPYVCFGCLMYALRHRRMARVLSSPSIEPASEPRSTACVPVAWEIVGGLTQNFSHPCLSPHPRLWGTRTSVRICSFVPSTSCGRRQLKLFWPGAAMGPSRSPWCTRCRCHSRASGSRGDRPRSRAPP